MSSSRAWTRSNAAWGRGSDRRSWRRTWIRSLASPSSRLVLTSTASTVPVLPTRWASICVTEPPPAPTSRQRQPSPTPMASSCLTLSGSWYSWSSLRRDRSSPPARPAVRGGIRSTPIGRDTPPGCSLGQAGRSWSRLPHERDPRHGPYRRSPNPAAEPTRATTATLCRPCSHRRQRVACTFVERDSWSIRWPGTPYVRRRNASHGLPVRPGLVGRATPELRSWSVGAAVG
jgi:hypothetical protein